ncbi:immune inhibitor A domain-containing protein [Streptomyces ficellus]|uniref:M6 family metalloprotease domain-containing protein n=1 Tax=Streptomyces ficellus TaxID=1977088 RepID=A0A6I6FJS2_9ACTN|nr:immune inhibitor A domain-containing protein [Streptomyces ficellus]QGV80402.1 M6 family metalloprotease domain-containing protein [Streptomyces ficellus]
MNTIRGALSAVAVLAVLAGSTAGVPTTTATAAVPATTAPVREDTAHGAAVGKHDGHVVDGPFSARERLRREAALEEVLSGRARVERRGGSKVVRLADRKYVELGRERTDKIFTILVEFGDRVDDETMHDPDGPGGPKPPVVKYGGTPGPLHNRIPEPDRTRDNSTDWRPDYDRAHFQRLYFGTGEGVESLRTYYEKASSGRYSVEGEVSDWVKVEYNEARYGSNYCGGNNCPNVEDLVFDGVAAWVADQRARGRTDGQIKEQVARFDEWDRTDHDNDGNFDEPDGYVDHFQIVHAGEDGSAGGGAQGPDALWAHRGYAYGRDDGDTGPAGFRAGGVAVGDTGVWVGDYTMQPENGGLGVFAHEYAHDLGLPDLYDTNNVAGVENSVGFWSLMSSGSWLGTGGEAIGDLPGDMTAWDKLQLGWLDYERAKAATASRHTLGVSAYHTDLPQGLVVELPEKTVTTPVVKPAGGAGQWWSDYGDGLSHTLARAVDLSGRSSASLRLDGWWDIEKDYDYLYAQVSTDGGESWKALDGTADGEAITRDGGGKPALTGVSGAYRTLVYPLDAYAGKRIVLRFRYKTDGGVAGKGFAADNVTVRADGVTLFADDAEGAEGAKGAGDGGWTARGFARVGESVTGVHPQYYIAENRQYVSYDRTLETGPYHFGFQASRDDWVEHYAYRPGLMIWQWDTSQRDNNVTDHPGQGLLLPVDAHPRPMTWSDGSLMSNKITPYDAAFSRYPVPGFTLHKRGVARHVAPHAGNPAFDDHKGVYWYAENEFGGVRTTDTNTRISIAAQPAHGSSVTVDVGPSVP